MGHIKPLVLTIFEKSQIYISDVSFLRLLFGGLRGRVSKLPKLRYAIIQAPELFSE